LRRQKQPGSAGPACTTIRSFLIASLAIVSGLVVTQVNVVAISLRQALIILPGLWRIPAQAYVHGTD
jgi:hypothetical protein